MIRVDHRWEVIQFDHVSQDTSSLVCQGTCGCHVISQTLVSSLSSQFKGKTFGVQTLGLQTYNVELEGVQLFRTHFPAHVDSGAHGDLRIVL